jgi:hypothetical protein
MILRPLGPIRPLAALLRARPAAIACGGYLDTLIFVLALPGAFQPLAFLAPGGAVHRLFPAQGSAAVDSEASLRRNHQ